MGFRYRKSIKILPGVKLNISKSGFSTSIGGKGASLNVSSRGTKVTTSISGTGISYSQYLSKPKRARKKAPTQPIQEAKRVRGRVGRIIFWIVVVFFFLLYMGARK